MAGRGGLRAAKPLGLDPLDVSNGGGGGRPSKEVEAVSGAATVLALAAKPSARHFKGGGRVTFGVTVKSDAAPDDAPPMEIGVGARPPRLPKAKRDTRIIHFTQHPCMLVYGAMPMDALRDGAFQPWRDAWDAHDAKFGPKWTGFAHPLVRCCRHAKGEIPRYALTVYEVTCKECLQSIERRMTATPDPKRDLPHKRQVEIAWLRCCRNRGVSPFSAAEEARILTVDKNERRARDVARVLATVDLTMFTVSLEKEDAAKCLAAAVASLAPDLRRRLAPLLHEAKAVIPSIKRDASRLAEVSRRLRSVHSAMQLSRSVSM